VTARIRLATPDDAASMLAIYAPIVVETAISFELEPPTPAAMRERIATTLERFPWLVCEERGEVLAYVYATRHRDRLAYQWSVDVSAYVHPAARRRGLAAALYTSLFALLRLQGFYKAYAGITLPNDPSVAFHESLGFRPLGIYQDVGYKLGRWRDVGWWQHTLQPPTHSPPRAPSDLSSAQAHPAWAAALAQGEAQG
jgi:L-amino acid N-acyltransferase YncA